MTVPETPTLPDEILQRIVEISIQSDLLTAFKIALAFRKCVRCHKRDISISYGLIIPRIVNVNGYYRRNLSLQDASDRGLLSLVEWWRSNGLELLSLDPYFANVLLTIDVKSLQRWEDTKSGFAQIAIKAGIACASPKEAMTTLDWWRQSKFDVIYDEEQSIVLVNELDWNP